VGGGRLRIALALALVGTLSGAATAAGNSAGSTDELRLTSTKPGTSTGVFATEIFNARYPNGQLKPLRHSLIGFPKGTRFSNKATPTCQASDADFKSQGMSACPEKSRIGHGNAEVVTSGAPFQLGPIKLDVTVFARKDGSRFVFSSDGAYLSSMVAKAKGRFQRVNPPPNCVYPNEKPSPGGRCKHGEFVPRSLTVTVSAHQRKLHGRLYRMITTPRHCTRSGHWYFFDKHTFADGSFDKFVNHPRCTGG
jgi:hypothetical protein